jgi:membrane fusion protein, multidrug efflux system
MTASLPARFARQLTPVRLAVLMAALLLLWLLLGDTLRVQETAPPAPEQGTDSLQRVETRWSEAQPMPREQVLHGQLQPWQSVRVMAQVSGRVEALTRQQGDRVAAGDVLLQLSDEGRSAQLAQAVANHRLRVTELESARRLKASNFASETEVIRLEGEVARAQAELRAAELAVQYNRPTAPFAGVVDRRHVELGELVQPGAELVALVNVERLKATAQIPQQEASNIAVGQPVRLVLLDGRELAGEVRFISLAAEPGTRSFHVEVEAQNPELWRVAGGSVTLRVQLAPVNAHRLSPSLLTLDANGQLGVHAVDEQQRVVHYPIRVVAIANDGATVAGLPDRVQLITQGAGFVTPGQAVEPVARPQGQDTSSAAAGLAAERGQAE